MARADVENAFRLLPINPEDYHFLGFTWNGKFYYDTCLPMGLSSSCQLFEKFSTALHWILTSSFGISNVSHLLDDFVFVSKASSKACDHALHSFLKLCKTIGVPIKHEKTRFPTTVLTIYGIEIDSNEMIARLPSDKIEKIYDMLVSVKRRRSVTLRDLQSLIGLLNFACSVIIPGRAFLRRLINLTLGHTNPQFRITLNAEARADLRAWFEFIEHFNGKLCFLFDNWVSSDTLRLYSDAAGVHGGFAAVFGNDWFTGSWPPEIEPEHITVKELFPIVLAVEIWGKCLENQSAPDCPMVVSKTDNSSSAIFNSVVAKLFTASLSDATHKSYSRMINSYLQFCETYYAECRPFPSSHILLSHFIANLFLRNYSPSTIATHISALSFVHKSNSWPDPTDMFVIHKILKGVQNLKGKNDPRLPITKDILIKLIDSLPCVIVNVDNQLALKAMFLLAFYAFLRVGEISTKSGSDTKQVLQVGDISFDRENSTLKGMSLTMTYYKHSDLHPKTIYIPICADNITCPVIHVHHYLSQFGHSSGPLFQFKSGAPVTRSYFTTSLKSALSFIGLDTRYYKAHSFRIGAATSAAARGIPHSVIQGMGRWKSSAFMKYIRMQNF
ncbi:unnamed protein product [Mytilus edulis]|uniref:Reverse transcriptase domain-containing protein n=1 Tax=Mytilus edulis TaxID=6550 RepID=A0A8S3Q5N7_MYTED|nr:unnamed protein product [Mytilus edulis]